MNCIECGMYFSNLKQYKKHIHCKLTYYGICTFIAHNKAEYKKHLKEKHGIEG